MKIDNFLIFLLLLTEEKEDIGHKLFISILFKYMAVIKIIVQNKDPKKKYLIEKYFLV